MAGAGHGGPVTWPALPLFVKVAGRPVILLGEGEAATAKRRLLERAGAVPVGEEAKAALAIVAIEEEAVARAAVARLRARGILVNAVDRPDLCDFTLPAIVDRSPVLVAVGTGGVSAGLAAALRQRLEAALSPRVGEVALLLQGAREALRRRFPDARVRRRAIAGALATGGPLDLADPRTDANWLAALDGEHPSRTVRITLRSPEPDDLTLGEARLLANADRVYHGETVPHAILQRARADAERVAGAAPAVTPPGLSVEVDLA